MTISAELFYEKKYDVSQEKNMGGITLLYFNDDRLIGRLVYLMCFRSDYYYKKAKELQRREREIKAARGRFWMQREKFWHQTGRYVQSL